MGRQFDRLIPMDHQVTFLVCHYSPTTSNICKELTVAINIQGTGEDHGSGGKGFLLTSLNNAYLLERYSNSSLYIPRRKQSYLSFRIDGANQLIGSYCFCLRAGRQRSAESDETRLNPTLGHWPIQDTKKLECTACVTTREKLNLTRKDLRHETKTKCSHCKVHLCINNDRNCFKLYHIIKRFWQHYRADSNSNDSE